MVGACLVLLAGIGDASSQVPKTQNRVFEWTFESRRAYTDPFNDVDIDVVFSKGAASWMGMSTRLSWEGFQKLTADRKAKGFTLIQLVAGLVPGHEQAPSDPGCCNEGGCVWEPEFKRINPRFFDYADRRVQHLVDSGMVPAIVGAWDNILRQMGVAKMKQHWRYIIERKLYDARGGYRGEMKGPGWDTFGREKIILLDGYRPSRLPTPQDWVLVLERQK